MKTFIILTAILWYEGVTQTAKTDFMMKFPSINHCQQYLFENKVIIVDQLMEKNRFRDDPIFGDNLELKGYEFYCETLWVEPEQEDEYEEPPALMLDTNYGVYL